MIKNLALLFFLVTFAAACNSLLSSKPSGTLSESKMTEVLIDIHITEATLRVANDSIARLNDTADLRNRFALVFRKHDVDPDNFNNSLNYYLEHIEELDKIYVEIISRLTELEASLQQKVVDLSGNTSGKLNFEPKMYQYNNRWFMTLYKQKEPLEIQYFNNTIYPKKQKITPALPGK